MWNRALIKSEAKSRLRRYYWMALLVCLVGNLVGGIAGGTSRGVSGSLDLDGELLYNPVFWSAVLGAGAIGALFSLAAKVLLGNPVEMGRNRYFLESREAPSIFEKLFFAFTGGGQRYKNVILTLFMRDLKLFLWRVLNRLPGVIISFLLVMMDGSSWMNMGPLLGLGVAVLLVEESLLVVICLILFVMEFLFGAVAAYPVFLSALPVAAVGILCSILPIIKHYEYRMVPYILSERPDLPHQRVFELSRDMTHGEKWKMLLLDLSFVGWYLLALLSCCVGWIFLQPYIEASYAELYTALREKAFGMGFSDRTELPGFLR